MGVARGLGPGASSSSTQGFLDLDGENDVSMVQMDGVGVVICDQEGCQAVMTSDFAMGQFRFLKRLLLEHGHKNY